MSFISLLLSKPVLVGLHLGFAILGIDLFLWYAGELIANPESRLRLKIAGLLGVLAFIASWVVGGYYYVQYYGPLVKPIIKAGSAPWAHAVAMEAKEHVFLFLVPMAITASLLTFLPKDSQEFTGLRKAGIVLAFTIAGLGLLIGLAGYMVSAAARWS